MIVQPPEGERFIEFQQEHFDIVEAIDDGRVRIVATARDREILETRYGAKVEIDNIEEYYRSEVSRGAKNGGFPTYGDIEVPLLFASFDEKVRVDTIGYTLEGRVIWAVKISDNVEIDEDEPEIMFNAMIHAREPIGLSICMDLIDSLYMNYDIDPDIQALVDGAEIWIIPVLNPDGYVYNEVNNPDGGGMWRKNRRDNGDGSFGVDLNRNFGFNWGLDDIGSSPVGEDETYRGTGPFSEPEMQVFHDFMLSHDFAVICNYHSYGNIYVKPWGFNRYLPVPDKSIYQEGLDSLYNFNGYPENPSMYSTNGGAYDYQYGEHFEKKKSFGYLPEVGYWFWPNSSDIYGLVVENRQANFFFIREAMRLWQQPTRAIGTTFTHFDTLFIGPTCASDFIIPATFYNVAEDFAIDVSVDFIDDMPLSGWFQIATSQHLLNYGDSVQVGLEFDPLAVGSLPPGQYSYEGFVRLIAVNTSIPSLVDTLKFPVYMNFEISDQDEDGLEDYCDNCPYDSNPSQIDIDEDGAGDVCDNCIEVYNPDQDDADEDSNGNLCDICPGFDDYADTDEDAIPDGCDNCPLTFNPSQSDEDENGVGDACDYVCGDGNGDGAPNIGDAVFVIAYVFTGGPAPDPLIAGDSNCDEACNVADAVYLINYVFKGGAAPCDGC